MKKNILLFFLMLGIALIIPSKIFAEENLQNLIDSLDDGAVLHLENKTYEGNIVIDKPIEIIGQNHTVIKGDGKGNTISIKTSGVTIRNVTVTHGSMNLNSSEEFAGIKVYEDGNIIDSVTVKHSFHGIYLSQSHHNTIQNSHIIGLGKGEIAKQGNGLHIYYSNDNILKNNVVEGTRDGMYFDYANNNEIIHNHLSETRYGLHFMYSHDNHFKGNTFTFNEGGAAVMESHGNKLAQNEFIFNYGHRSFGLLLLSSFDTVIENNTFFMNQRGLYIDQSTNNLIKNNHIVKNQIGVEIWASSNEQIFTQNKIEENTIPVFALGGQGRNEWSKDGAGNDWGPQFPILDLNQDKIGDDPIIYQSSLAELIEDQEITYLFLKSPAITVYEKINQFFSKPKTMFEDPAPLVNNKEFKLPWIWVVTASIIVILILLKGRQLLCITFGRNGRKT